MILSLWQSIRAGLAVPLLIAAVLGAMIGFLAGRSVYPEPAEALVAVVSTTQAPQPTPSPIEEEELEPEEGGSGDGSGGSRRSSRRSCPAGCQCSFPPGGLVVRCGGSATSSSTSSDGSGVSTPRPQGPPPSMPDLPGMG